MRASVCVCGAFEFVRFGFGRRRCHNTRHAFPGVNLSSWQPATANARAGRVSLGRSSLSLCSSAQREQYHKTECLHGAATLCEAWMQTAWSEMHSGTKRGKAELCPHCYQNAALVIPRMLFPGKSSNLCLFTELNEPQGKSLKKTKQNR